MLVKIKIIEKRVIEKYYDVDYDFQALGKAANEYDNDVENLINTANSIKNTFVSISMEGTDD